MKDETLETKMEAGTLSLAQRMKACATHNVLHWMTAVEVASEHCDATIRIAREHAEARVAPRDMLIDGLERLLTAYRIGGRPSEATLTKIEKAKAQIAAEQAHAEARREPREGEEGR
jgi:hypothetical protein